MQTNSIVRPAISSRPSKGAERSDLYGWICETLSNSCLPMSYATHVTGISENVLPEISYDTKKICAKRCAERFDELSMHAKRLVPRHEVSNMFNKSKLNDAEYTQDLIAFGRLYARLLQKNPKYLLEIAQHMRAVEAMVIDSLLWHRYIREQYR